jgi:hypothetical protein
MFLHMVAESSRAGDWRASEESFTPVSTIPNRVRIKKGSQMNPKSLLKSGALVVGATLASALLVACSGSEADGQASASHSASPSDPTDEAFRDAMRVLWEDHIAWTRLAIVSIAGGLPDAAATTERLLQNQVDIGDAVKPYYGGAAGDQLTALLKDHIVIAADLVTAAKAGDNAAVERAQGRWYANADAIGTFLASANPDQWKEGEMKSMMREHLDLTLQEAVHYLTGDHRASVTDYDKIHVQILAMADMLSDGIIAQFPDAFTAKAAGH